MPPLQRVERDGDMSDRQVGAGQGNRAGSRSRVLQRMFGYKHAVLREDTRCQASNLATRHTGGAACCCSARAHPSTSLSHCCSSASITPILVDTWWEGRKEVGFAWRVSTGGGGVVPETETALKHGSVLVTSAAYTRVRDKAATRPRPAQVHAARRRPVAGKPDRSAHLGAAHDGRKRLLGVAHSTHCEEGVVREQHRL